MFPMWEGVLDMNEDTICWILNQIQHSDLTPFDVENLAFHLDNMATANAQEIDRLNKYVDQLKQQRDAFQESAMQWMRWYEELEQRFNALEDELNR